VFSRAVSDNWCLWSAARDVLTGVVSSIFVILHSVPMLNVSAVFKLVKAWEQNILGICQAMLNLSRTQPVLKNENSPNILPEKFANYDLVQSHKLDALLPPQIKPYRLKLVPFTTTVTHDLQLSLRC